MCTTVGLVLVVVVFTRKFMMGGTRVLVCTGTRHVVECVCLLAVKKEGWKIFK